MEDIVVEDYNGEDYIFIQKHVEGQPVEEILYTAMEDFAIDLVVGKGPSARTMRIDLPRFTLLGATTMASLLSGPLRDRFGHVEKLRYYEPEEIEQIIARSAKILNIPVDADASRVLARSSRRTPRIANRVLRRVRDVADIVYEGNITLSLGRDGLQQLSVDAIGLDRSDQEFLQVLCTKFSGGPTGLSTLAAAMGEDEHTIESMIEPFLIREGFLQRTSRGRMATEAAWKHLGLIPPVTKVPLGIDLD